MASIEDDDEIPQLSGDAFAALKEFYGERDARQKQFEELKGQAEDDFDGKLSMDAFTEDWNASRSGTATKLPWCSRGNFWRNSGEVKCRPQIKLLEFDERFAVFKEFVRYDFEKAIQLPAEMKASFDVIICDPPFLSQDCQTKAALTVRWLAKSWSQDSLRLIIIKGEIPSMKIFESEKTLAFLDIGPLSKGHSLIIPKHHGAKLHDIPDDQLAEVLSVTKRIAIAQNIQDYNILQNNGRIAHQVVDHVHFHLIPKPNEQEGLGIGWPTKEADKGELSKLPEEIKSKM
ncbi:hypothetical protein AG0111_0g9392 [Alternaria gaisen]|uniref:Uncharacterized protein n=1 Tax=Alternaria gaisen TaxID=167740 RepID=A0ACB6FF84_9PLEO|nr:hypothetical protein AG0111_0g9392 [Alternaria gaisen]